MRLNRFLKREAERPSIGHNLCGVLVHAEPGRLALACRHLAELPGVEIHEQAPDGRMVVTIEDVEGLPAALTLAKLHEIEGVASAALVYHHCETEDRSEEMSS